MVLKFSGGHRILVLMPPPPLGLEFHHCKMHGTLNSDFTEPEGLAADEYSLRSSSGSKKVNGARARYIITSFVGSYVY